ncbi:hypothetical protein [Desulfosporosinus fructosivorans]
MTNFISKRIVLMFIVGISVAAAGMLYSHSRSIPEEEMFLARDLTIIESKLDAICNNSNPKVQLSSNPYESTKDSQDLKDIVNFGDDALRYMLTKFENGEENGLKEYVMAIACSEILKENPETKKWASGREWYDRFLKSRTIPHS